MQALDSNFVAFTWMWNYTRKIILTLVKQIRQTLKLQQEKREIKLTSEFSKDT